MKKNYAMMQGLLLAVLAGGCGEEAPPAPPPSEMCAMNPLAVSCGGAQETSSAVKAPPDFTGIKTRAWGSYNCAGVPTPAFIAIGTTDTYLDDFGAGWISKYDYSAANTPASAAGFVNVTISSPRMLVAAAMDGPYHILYNTSTYTEVTMNTHAKPGYPGEGRVTIPPYGTWIYAPGERPDYPTGVQVITFDPQGTPDPNGGRCAERVQFVTAL